MEILSELQIIRGSKFAITKFFKSRVKHLSTGSLKSYVAAKVSESFRPYNVVLLAAEHLENCIDARLCIWIAFSRREILKFNLPLNFLLTGSSAFLGLYLSFDSQFQSSAPAPRSDS